MKTVQEYLNDPRILNDPDMAETLEPIKVIHAIRLKTQDETANMTENKNIEALNIEADRLVPLGKPFAMI